MDEITSIKGPVERFNGQLVLRIPLEIGGAKLAKVARGIGEVQGGLLVVTIPIWLALKIGITEGRIVHIRVDPFVKTV